MSDRIRSLFAKPAEIEAQQEKDRLSASLARLDKRRRAVRGWK